MRDANSSVRPGHMCITPTSFLHCPSLPTDRQKFFEAEAKRSAQSEPAAAPSRPSVQHDDGDDDGGPLAGQVGWGWAGCISCPARCVSASVCVQMWMASRGGVGR